MVGIPAYTAEYALTGSRDKATAHTAMSFNARAGGVNPALFQYRNFLNCYENCIHYIGPRIRLPSGTTIEEFCRARCWRPWRIPGPRPRWPIPEPWW